MDVIGICFVCLNLIFNFKFQLRIKVFTEREEIYDCRTCCGCTDYYNDFV